MYLSLSWTCSEEILHAFHAPKFGEYVWRSYSAASSKDKMTLAQYMTIIITTISTLTVLRTTCVVTATINRLCARSNRSTGLDPVADKAQQDQSNNV